jgi:hypothetical protein
MSRPGLAVRLLRVAIVLAAIFNILALIVMVRTTPIAFTLFMFVGQPLFAIAFVVLLAAILADLRARQIL